MKLDEPVLKPDYESGFICPLCYTHNPILTLGQDGVLRLQCPKCGYYVTFKVEDGN
jgi:Zn ribbon nucleic-acid-binding protein